MCAGCDGGGLHCDESVRSGSSFAERCKKME